MNSTSDTPAADPHSGSDADRSSPAPLVELNSEELFHGAREILIRHKDETYRLRLTKNDRLILHK